MTGDLACQWQSGLRQRDCAWGLLAKLVRKPQWDLAKSAGLNGIWPTKPADGSPALSDGCP